MMLAVAAIISVVIIVIDQVIKGFIYQGLYPDGRVTVIKGLLELIYSENRGAAFGIFQNATLIFAVITVVIVAIFVYLMATGKLKGKLFTISVALIIGGGIGNLIDRLFRGFVIDYLALSFFPPVCNFADYCITIGAVLFVLAVFLSPELSAKKQEPERDGEADE